MELEFENGSSISSIKSENVIRGERSNFVTTICLDINTGEYVLKEIDLRKPYDRYIPTYFLETNNKEEHME